jgi:branched-chain amino acid aminotransferase
MPRASWSSGAAYIDGRFLPIEEAAILITDWGYRRSDATYDVMAVSRGVFFRLDDHLKRFRNSMRALRLDPPETDDSIRRVLAECVCRLGLREAYVAMDCLRGTPRPGQARHPFNYRNYLTTFAIPWLWVVSPEVQARGAHLVIAKTPRISGASVDPTVKNFHWSDFTRGLFETYDQGAGVLEGITQLSVEELCNDFGISFTVRPCRLPSYEKQTKFSWRRRQVALCRLHASTSVFLVMTGLGRSPRAYARHSGRSARRDGTQLPSTMRYINPMHKHQTKGGT